MEYFLMILSVVIGIVGIVIARSLYAKGERIAAKPSGIGHKLLWNKYYIDEIYTFLVINPIQKASDVLLWKGFDVNIIDGIVNGSGRLVNAIGGQLRKVQVGIAQVYAFAFVLGIVVVLGIMILK